MIQEPNLSDYERGGLLGRGGQATVYRYSYPQTNELFAVKVLKLACMSTDDRPLTAKDKEWCLREVLMTSETNHVRHCR